MSHEGRMKRGAQLVSKGMVNHLEALYYVEHSKPKAKAIKKKKGED